MSCTANVFGIIKVFLIRLTGDIIGVVEAVAVEFAGGRLSGGGTLLSLPRKTDGGGQPLSAAVAVAWLGSTEKEHSDITVTCTELFMHVTHEPLGEVKSLNVLRRFGNSTLFFPP